MGRLFESFVKHNGPWLAHTLRALARQVELIAPGRARFAVVLFINRGEITVAEATVTTELADLTARVKFTDAEGNETQPDGTPAWSSSDEAVATVSASEDGFTATISVGSPGVALIEVRSQETDNETGDAYELVAQGTLTVQPGDAVIGSVEFDVPAGPTP